MQAFLHHVIGLYPTPAAAEAVRDDLLRSGLQFADLRIRRPGQDEVSLPAVPEGDDPELALLLEGVGAGVNQAVDHALADVSLFAASPVLGSLMALGWRAALGGLVGARAAATGSKPSPELADSGAVLVVRCHDVRQTALARMIVAASMADVAPLPAGADERLRTAAPGAANPTLLPRAPVDRRRQPDRRAPGRTPSGRVQ